MFLPKQSLRRASSTQIEIPQNFTPTRQSTPKRKKCLFEIETPLQIRIAKKLGLKQFLIENLIFKKRKPSYSINCINNKNYIVLDSIYQPPIDWSCEVQILEKGQHSIPVIRTVPMRKESDIVIIYAHGNHGDLGDSLKFIQGIMKLASVQIVAFDYTGYGASRIKETNENKICTDLQIVMSWITRYTKLENIVLWGFSLGTYPVSYCSSLYGNHIKGCILQSPIASVSCLFHKVKQMQRLNKINFEQDYLCNHKLIGKINCPIMMIHSTSDQTIPFVHSQILLQKYKNENHNDNLLFLEVNTLKHNQMHQFMISVQSNPLQTQLVKFLQRMMKQTNHQMRSSRISLSSVSDQLLSSRCSQILSNFSQCSHLKNQNGQFQRKYSRKRSKINLVTSNKYNKFRNKKDLNKLYEELKKVQIEEDTEIQFYLHSQDGGRRVRKIIMPKKSSVKFCSCLDKC